MNNAPTLIVILIKHNKNSPWIILKASEIRNEKEIIEFMKWCRKKAKEDNREEKFKIEYYAPV